MITTLNPLLIEQQELTEMDVEAIELMHEARAEMFTDMKLLDPLTDSARLKKYVEAIKELEFDLQRAWKFEVDEKFHTWWYRAPHCSCPVLDNMDRVGIEGKVVNCGCPLHGDSSE